MLTRFAVIRGILLGAAALTAAVCFAPDLSAQRRPDWDWDGNYNRLPRFHAGLFVAVRTNQPIQSNWTDGRIFTGTVVDDVWDDYRRIAVPAIPHGSRVDLIVRTAHDGDLILDLDAVYAYGRRYIVDAVPTRIEGESRHGEEAEMIGAGAVLGTIIGAIAGGGKGAAIGAAAGAAAGGVGLAFRGHAISIPPGSVLTFRLEHGLVIGRDEPRYPRRSPR